MADKIKAIKIKQKNGTYSEEVPISVNVQNVQWDENNHTLLDALGSVDISSSGKGNLQHQIDELDGDKISTNQFNSRLNDFLREQISEDTTDWLDDNVNPVGSAVIVDKTLTIDGAAADALAVKTELNKKADASNTYTKAEVNAAIDAKQIEVDDTLSITGTAADAKAVGDELTAVKADLNYLVSLPYITGYAVSFSQEPVDLVNLLPSTRFKWCAIVDCIEGDVFIINATGLTAVRAWAILDSSNMIISMADANAVVENLRLVMPAGASKLVVNSTSDAISYKYGKNYLTLSPQNLLDKEKEQLYENIGLKDNLKDLNESLNNIDNTLFGESAEERSEIFTDAGREGPKLYINYTNGVKESFSVTWSYVTDFIPIIGGSVIELSGVNTNNGQDKRGFAFYDESKQYLNGVQYINETTNYSLTTRNDARYIRITYDGISENPKIYMTVDGEEGGIIRQLNDIEEKIESYEIDPSNPFSKIVNSIGLIEIFDTVGCIGDSLASGECVSSNHGNIDLYQFSWGQYLSRMTGNTYYNFSAGGVTTKSWHTNSYCAPICFDGNHLCKMYIIGLGQNDANIIRNQSSASQSTYIGTTEDINISNYNANADTFYGNYGKIIQRIKEVQPKGKIFILTDPADYVEETGINTAIRNIATLFTNVYLLDLYRFKNGVYNSEIITNTRRGGHYNAIGYHEMALYLATYIDWYIRNNLSEFNQVEFIGTDYVYNA